MLYIKIFLVFDKSGISNLQFPIWIKIGGICTYMCKIKIDIIGPKRDYVLSLCKITTEWLEE